MKNNKLSISCTKLLLFLVFSFLMIYAYKQSSTYADNYQESIAGKIVRFHVVANSDSDEDQELKLKVRDAVLDFLHEDMNSANDFDSTIRILKEKCPKVTEVARHVIKDNGYDYDVTASVCECYFPAKTYCDIILPPGDYTALKIVIGEGNGHNWWCVMFPTLCFIDTSTAVLPNESKNELKAVLTPDEYDSILLDDSCANSSDVTIKYSSHLLEAIASLFD